MSQKKLMNLMAVAMLVLQVIAEVLVGVIIWRLNVLPAQYGILLVLIGLILAGVTGVLCFVRQKNDKGHMIRQGVACGMAVLVIIMSAVVATVASDIHDALSGITGQPGGDTVTRTVYVLKDDAAQNLKGAAKYKFGRVTGHDELLTQRAIDKIQQELGSQILIAEYASMPELLEAFTAKQVNAIILSEMVVSMLQEIEGYENFSSQVRALYVAQVPVYENDPVDSVPPTTVPSVPSQPSSPSEPTVPPTEPPTEPPTLPPRVDSSLTEAPFVVYIGGSDSRDATLHTGRNDVNILAVVNPVTKQVLLINTPRDFYLPNPAGGGALDKLTHCGNNGLKNTIGALSALYNVNIDHTAHINFSGFETLIDAIGGITVNSPIAFKGYMNEYTFVKGENHVDGAKALAFARERYAFATGDNQRGKNQMQVIQAVIKKLTSGTTILSNYASILNSMKGMFKTSVGMDDVTELVRMQLDDMADWEVFTYAAWGSGASKETWSMPGWKLYVTIPNESSVAHAHDLMAKVLSGQVLKQSDI